MQTPAACNPLDAPGDLTPPCFQNGPLNAERGQLQDSDAPSLWWRKRLRRQNARTGAPQPCGAGGTANAAVLKRIISYCLPKGSSALPMIATKARVTAARVPGGLAVSMPVWEPEALGGKELEHAAHVKRYHRIAMRANQIGQSKRQETTAGTLMPPGWPVVGGSSKQKGREKAQAPRWQTCWNASCQQWAGHVPANPLATVHQQAERNLPTLEV